MKKKTPTLADRLEAAGAKTASALAAFDAAAVALEASASEHDDLADEAQAEIERLAEVRDLAAAASARASRAASKVRDLTA